MRIGYLIDSFPCISETFVINDMRGFEALGHEVCAIALSGADPNTVGNTNYTIKGKTIRVKGLNPPVLRKLHKLSARRALRQKYGAVFEHLYNDKPELVPPELWQDRLTWDAALAQIDRENIDFLYVDFAMRQLLLGYFASRLLQIPLAVTMHAHDIFVNPLAKFFPHTLGQCSFITTVSGYNRQAILKMVPSLEASSVHVLGKGVDVGAFAPQFHEPHRPFRFAGTGRLVEIKGFHVLVEAAGILAKTRRDFIVQIVGEGELRPSLESRIAELGIGDVFKLLGRKDATFLKSFLPEQDCFAMPCVIAKDGNRDGLPAALREGMACGLPALSTELLSLHETVSPGTGLLVKPDDPAALAEGMRQLIELSPAEHRAMSESARNKAVAEFSLQHEVKLLEGWMQETLRQRTTKPEARNPKSESNPKTQ